MIKKSLAHSERKMKHTYITILGLSTFGLGGCNTESNPTSSTPTISPTAPDTSRRTFNPPEKERNLADPNWDEVKAPHEGAKAELIVTPNGCYKNFVADGVEPKDRYEETPDTTKIGTFIECPERAKEIPKTEPKKEEPPPININPPAPPPPG